MCAGWLAASSPALAAERVDDSVIAQALARTLSDPDSVATVTIAAPADFVFRFLTQRPQDYTEDAVAVSFDHTKADPAGELAPGSERVITLADGKTLVQRFLWMESPSGYAYQTDMTRSTVAAPLQYAVTRYALTADGEATTQLRVSLVYEPTTRLLAFFVKRAFAAALQRDFARAATVIERAWAESPNPPPSQPP